MFRNEAAFQTAVVDMLKAEAPPVLFHGTLNGAHMSMAQRMKMKRTGMMIGIPDLLIFEKSANGMFVGLAIELKMPRGVVTEIQQQRHGEFFTRGWAVYVVRSFAEVTTIWRAYRYDKEWDPFPPWGFPGMDCSEDEEEEMEVEGELHDLYAPGV